MQRVVEHVRQDRLWQRHMDVARHGATPAGGVDRQALSPVEAEAKRYLLDHGRARGLAAYTDAIGNFFLRLDGEDPGLAPVLTGSHIDSQPTGGRFDGIFGVLAGFEVLEAFLDAGVRPRRSIELVSWTNEEGSRFAPGMMGSEAFAGVRDLASILAVRDAAGTPVADALAETKRLLPGLPERPLGFPIAGYVEAHIEQGPVLEREGRVIGAVTGIQGKQTFRVVVVGEEAHAGTKPMAERRDALIAAARMVQAMHAAAVEAGPDVMFTVGRFAVEPNAPSVVPARVTFSIDLRHPDTALMRRLGRQIPDLCRAAAESCSVDVVPLVDVPSIEFPRHLRNRILDAARELGLPAMELLSAAGHDARQMHGLAPSAMIFVPCRRGISHHEAEWAEPEHLAAGARVLATLLLEASVGEADFARVASNDARAPGGIRNGD